MKTWLPGTPIPDEVWSSLLQSVEAPAITQVRASDDHVPPGTTAQWRMGYSSLFSWSIGVAPFKDNSWSTSRQPGGRIRRLLNASPFSSTN